MFAIIVVYRTMSLAITSSGLINVANFWWFVSFRKFLELHAVFSAAAELFITIF